MRALIPLLLLACAPDDSPESPGGDTPVVDTTDSDTVGLVETDPPLDTPTEPTGDTGPPPCANLLSSFPEPDAVDIGRGIDLQFEMDRRGSVQASLEADGVGVSGSGSWDGNTLQWSPATRLEPGTLHTATLTGTCEPVSISFTTAGEPFDPTQLIGRTYALNVVGGSWVRPMVVGPFLATLFTSNSLVQVDAIGTDTIDFSMAAADRMSQQRLEFETATLVGADFSGNPRFDYSGPLPLGGALTDFLRSARIQGRFASGGTEIVDMEFIARVDSRPLSTLIGFATPGGLCALIGPIAACQPCGGAVGDFCMDVEIRNLTAPEVPNTDITPVASTAPTAVCGTTTTGWWGLGLLALMTRRRRRAAVQGV